MKLLKKKKDSEFLSIKEINKKVKLLTPLKDNESDNEYNLAIILKSLTNILYNFSRQLNLGNDSKQELDIKNITQYLIQFKNKPYYIIKICPIIYFLKSHFLLSKKEKAFLITIKDIQLNINEVNHLNDNQIDCINYILIKNFEALFTLNENWEIILDLFYIFKEIKEKKYNYLLEYYKVVLLIITYFFDNQKNQEIIKITTNMLEILYNIISREKNNDISEFAFLVFCELYAKLNINDNPFTFTKNDKWVLMILKLFKGEICLFNLESDNKNNIYTFIGTFHKKFCLGEVERIKRRSSFIKQNIFQNQKLPENTLEAQTYLNDKLYDKFPKELHLPKGPFNNVYKYLYYYNKDFTNKLNGKKKKLIFGALQISSTILKTKYQDSNFDSKYFAIKLSNEIIKRIIFTYKKDKKILSSCLICFGDIIQKSPEHIIK